MRPRRRLAGVLTVLFLAAMVIGAGPGVWLVNPADPGRRAVWWGAPVIWLWAVAWLLVQWTVLLVACRTLWKDRR